MRAAVSPPSPVSPRTESPSGTGASGPSSETTRVTASTTPFLQWRLHRTVVITVHASALRDGTLYVAGVFDHAGGAPANATARWDRSAWPSLGSEVAYPGFQTSVRAIGIHGSDVIAGGAFLQAGVAAATNLARWDGQNWFPFGGGCNGFPTTILAFSDQVFVGGNFTQIGGFNVTALAEWDGTNWMSLGSGFKGPQPAVSQLAANGTDLYVVGSFTEA